MSGFSFMMFIIVSPIKIPEVFGATFPGGEVKEGKQKSVSESPHHLILFCFKKIRNHIKAFKTGGAKL